MFSSSTFTHNMLAFGLNKKLCSDFLKKQAVIGNLDEGELCWGCGGARAAPLHWGFPPSQKEGICHRNLPSFPNPWSVYSGCTTGSCFC